VRCVPDQDVCSVVVAGADLQLELVAVRLEQRFDLGGRALREDQRAQPEPGGLERAVERAPARAARVLGGDHVDGHVADGHVIEIEGFGPKDAYTKSNGPPDCSAC